MSSVLSSQNGVRARKKHHCCLCGEPVPAGTLYDKRAGVGSDGFWTMHMHPECHAYEKSPGVVDSEWYEDVSFPAFDRVDAFAYQLSQQ